MKTREWLRPQRVGAVWTLVYALFSGLGPSAFRNSDIESVLVLFLLPILCLLAVFGYLRNGGYLAFGTLALATAFSIPHTTLYSMLALLAGGPLALAWSLWLDRSPT